MQNSTLSLILIIINIRYYRSWLDENLESIKFTKIRKTQANAYCKVNKSTISPPDTHNWNPKGYVDSRSAVFFQPRRIFLLQSGISLLNGFRLLYYLLVFQLIHSKYLIKVRSFD